MREKGFNLFELTLCVALIVGLGAMTYKLFTPSVSMAAIRVEQERSAKIVQSVTDLYVLHPSYDGLNTDTLRNTFNSNFVVQNGALHPPSSVAEMTVVQPGSAFGNNDSIDLVYLSVPSKTCVKLASAIGKSADFVQVNGFQLQRPYSRMREDLLATQCSTRNNNEILFRYTNKHTVTAAEDISACECSPTIETQTLACPGNTSGSITQRRNGTCPSSTCPKLQWSSWATMYNTCAANPTPIVPITPIPPSSQCIETTETQIGNCPATQIGYVVNTRTKECPSGQWGGWTTTLRACNNPLPISPSCAFDPITDKETSSIACPSGQGGSISRERYRNCNGSGIKEWGEWKTVNNSCAATCVTLGTCCTPGRLERPANAPCPINSYGTRTGVEQQYSRCASATETPVWSGIWDMKGSSIVGVCHTCPANSSSTLERTEPRTGACPAGTFGNQTWEAIFKQTVNISYACNSSANQTDPGRSETYGNWVESGSRNHNQNCSTCPTPYNETDEQWVRVDYGCPVGYSGQNGFDKQQHRQRAISFSCPSGQTTPPSPNVGAWGGWYDTGAQRNQVNSCAASCTVDNRSYRIAWQNSSPLNGLKDCNGSNIGQRSWSNYISCSAMGPCGGTFRAAICTASGWQIVAGAGSSPYVGWASGRPAEWDALFMQGYNDAPAIGAQQGSSGQSNWITYQCL